MVMNFCCVPLGMLNFSPIISLCNFESNDINWICLTAGWIVAKFLLRRLCNDQVICLGKTLCLQQTTGLNSGFRILVLAFVTNLNQMVFLLGLGLFNGVGYHGYASEQHVIVVSAIFLCCLRHTFKT